VADSARYDVFKLVEDRVRRQPRAIAPDAGLAACRRRAGAGLLPIVAMEVLKLATLARAAARRQTWPAAMRDARVWDSKQALYRRCAGRPRRGACEALRCRNWGAST
jgi:DNA polymerase-3 subunit delta